MINPTTAGASPAGGTITFRLYGPTATIDGLRDSERGRTSCSPRLRSPSRVTRRARSSTSRRAFIVNAPGFYHWIATYSGNLPNTNGDAGQCGDANETVQVLQIPTNIKTKQSWFPNDTATISAQSGNLGPTGQSSSPCTAQTTAPAPCCTPIRSRSPVDLPRGGRTSNTSVSAVVTDYADEANSVKPGAGRCTRGRSCTPRTWLTRRTPASRARAAPSTSRSHTPTTTGRAPTCLASETIDLVREAPTSSGPLFHSDRVDAQPSTRNVVRASTTRLFRLWCQTVSSQSAPPAVHTAAPW